MYCVYSARSARVMRVVSVVCSIAILYVAYCLYRHIYYIISYRFGELSDMHFYYDTGDGNSIKAQRLYGENYTSAIPSTEIFAQYGKMFREEPGSVYKKMENISNIYRNLLYFL